MKKFLLTTAIVMAMGFCASAQDGFFRSDADGGVRAEGEDVQLILPNRHGLTDDQQGAPLGSGLLILVALGGAYAIKKH